MPKPDDEDYAHTEDPQVQRTRYELWAILILVATIVVASLIWRVATGHHAGPQKGWGPTPARSVPGAAPNPAAGASVAAHGAAAPP